MLTLFITYSQEQKQKQVSKAVEQDWHLYEGKSTC